jgi:tetratricopeptide (TPR) repeat protein
VYRSQLISLIELESLKSAEGGLIAVTSFLSTTRNHKVATMFAGDGEKPPNLELVLFEICIEQLDLEEERRPFADISEVSSKQDEDEILLCMGTVMRIESVKIDEEITRIRLRICPYDDSTWQSPKVDLLPHESWSTVDETRSLFFLGTLLLNMGEGKKAEQFFSMIESSVPPEINQVCQVQLIKARMIQTKATDPNYSSNCLMGMREIQKLTQSFINSELIPDFAREIFKPYVEHLDNMLEMMNSKSQNSSKTLMLLENAMKMYETAQRFALEIARGSMNPSLLKSVGWRSESAESSNEQLKSTMYDRLKSNMNNVLSEKDYNRPAVLVYMAYSFAMDGDYDRAISLVREGLSVTCSYNSDTNVILYQCLVTFYKGQKNWSEVIESCQIIIDMPQIPPSSSAIIKAYIERGNACIELADLGEAYFSYTKALELQNQHHAPNHPLTSEIYIEIGNLFEKADNVSDALESYEKAIRLGSPNTASEAYKRIGIMYMCRKNDDVARSNFIKCLEIREHSIPHETFSLAWTHMLLAQLEHKNGCYQQRDFHIQEARKIADRDEEHRDFIVKHISRILGHKSLVGKTD